MYASQLATITALDPVAAPHFHGIFARDEVFKTKFPFNQKFYTIVNIAPKGHSGLHWVLFFLQKRQEVIFFDSFAQSPAAYGVEFENTLLKFSKYSLYPGRYKTLTLALQSTKSDICGKYCLYFAHELCRGKSINTIATKFSENKSDNDQKINNWLEKFFHNKIQLCLKFDGQSCLCIEKWRK